MRRYIVHFPSLNEEKIEAALPVSRYRLAEGLWAVGSTAKTTADLSEQLGIGKNEITGVVVSMEEFYGYYDNALWQRLEAWGLADE